MKPNRVCAPFQQLRSSTQQRLLWSLPEPRCPSLNSRATTSQTCPRLNRQQHSGPSASKSKSAMKTRPAVLFTSWAIAFQLVILPPSTKPPTNYIAGATPPTPPLHLPRHQSLQRLLRSRLSPHRSDRAPHPRRSSSQAPQCDLRFSHRPPNHFLLPLHHRQGRPFSHRGSHRPTKGNFPHRLPSTQELARRESEAPAGATLARTRCTPTRP